MRIATLGPEGTFSHEAVSKLDKSAKVAFADTIRDVFEIVGKNDSDIGLVPAENSIAGTVGQTLDCLTTYNLKIIEEQVFPIVHNLVGVGRISDIKRLYLHPQTYEQCEIFIKKNLKNAEVIPTSSNGKSAELVSREKDRSAGSIISKAAADIYRLKILKKGVQDSKFNVTRFFVIGRTESGMTGYDRTSIAIYPQIDRPGLLYGFLGEFAKRGINLTKIESRPSKGKLGDYIFYIDFEGHKLDNNVSDALEEIEKAAFVKVLGSYPRKY